MHKNIHCRAHGRLQAMGLEREESREELLFLLVFGVLEVKDGLDRTGVNK